MPATIEALRAFRYMGSDMKIHADSSDSAGKCAVIEVTTYPGCEPPLHIHDDFDELFIVIEGQMKVIRAGVETILGPGESAIVKRGTPHTFKVLTPTLRSIGVITPGGFEDFFRTLAGDTPPSFQQIGETAARFGTRLVR